MVDLAGAGLAESIAETNQSLNRDDIDLGEVVLNSAAVGFDALGVLANPIEAFATAGIGFLIEHLKPLRDVLDWTTGDPDGVRSAVERWNSLAGDLDKIAGDHRPAADRLAPTWMEGGSESSVNCGEIMDFRADQIYGASMACIALADQTTNAATWIAAARGVVRDMIAGYVWETLKKAAVKLSFAPVSFGASAAEFVIDAVIHMCALIRKINGVLKKALDWLHELAKGMAKVAKYVDKHLGVLTRPKPIPRPGVGTALKSVLDGSREAAKADSTERQAPAEKTDRVDDLHEQHDDGVNQIETDVAKDPAPIERSPQRKYETKDWWSRRGTVY